MKKTLLLILMLNYSFVQASDWPAQLVQKTYDGCNKKGGASQCECLVTRLQHKFTFEDMKLTRTNPLAFEALKQAIEAYNVKCLDSEFKKETQRLKKQK